MIRARDASTSQGGKLLHVPDRSRKTHGQNEVGLIMYLELNVNIILERVLVWDKAGILVEIRLRRLDDLDVRRNSLLFQSLTGLVLNR